MNHESLIGWMEGTRAVPEGRALVTLSYAQSLDGGLAAGGGRPTAISCAAALEACHVIRCRHDAIMVGVGTILADNPMLTVRRVKGRNPRPVILDSHLRMPAGSNVLGGKGGRGGSSGSGGSRGGDGEGPLIFCGEGACREAEGRLRDAGGEVRRLPLEGGGSVLGGRGSLGGEGAPEGTDATESTGGRGGGARLPLGRVLRVLRECGLESVMVEGGGRLIGDFLRTGLWDRAAINAAPFWLGGYGIDYSSGAKIHLDDVRWVTYESDVFCLGVRA